MDDRQRASAIRGLASLIAAGMPPLVALGRWATAGDPAPELEQVSRRALLPLAIPDVLLPLEEAWGSDGVALSRVVATGAYLGRGICGLLEDEAERIERRARGTMESRSASAAARLSMRLVLAIPALAIVGAVVRGGPGVLVRPSVALGTVLGAVGWWWIAHLSPGPPATDPEAIAARALARALASGTDLIDALTRAAGACPPDVAERLRGVRARLATGVDLRTALERGRLDPLLRSFSGAADLGLPSAAALLSLADRRTMEARFRYETLARRAPVLMALPLSLCVLPAFVLLGAAPFLE